jgi:hypothetical protein
MRVAGEDGTLRPNREALDGNPIGQQLYIQTNEIRDQLGGDG